MKKTLFLLMPLLVLSSCGINQQAKEEEPLQYKESTEDVEEIFGENAFKKGDERKYRLTSGEAEPKLGFQTRTYKKGDDDFYAIRFTAELVEPTSSAIWTRTIYNVSDGSVFQAAAPKQSTVFYTALYDGTGERYVPEGSYTCFAIYTLYDIPADLADDYYINAYLTIDGATKTKVGTVSSRNHFAYDYGTTGYFLAVNSNGEKNGTSKSRIYKGNSNLANPDKNNGEIGADLEKNETFILVNIYTDHLVTYNHSTNMIDLTNFTSVANSDMSKVVNGDHYYFYLSQEGDNKMYVTKANAYYLKPGVWAQDNARFALYAFQGNGDGENYMVNMYKDYIHEDLYVGFLGVDKGYAKCNFVRLKPDGGVNWDAKWNQTADLTLQAGKKYEITGWGENDGQWKDLTPNT